MSLLERLPQDEARRKELELIHDTLVDLARLESESPDEKRRAAVLREIAVDPANLDRDQANEILLALKLLLLTDADATIAFSGVQDERRWTRHMTSWLTWDELFGRAEPPGLKEFLAGKDVRNVDLTANRRHMVVLLRARHDDMLVHRARQALRRKNLAVLSQILAALLFALVPLTAFALLETGSAPPIGLLLGVLAGMLGSTLSGTIRARDRLARAADIEAFLDGLTAQVLVGASAALAITVLFGSGLVSIGSIDLSSWPSLTALGFLAGFSEPFFIGTVRRAAALGAEEPNPSTPPAA